MITYKMEFADMLRGAGMTQRIIVAALPTAELIADDIADAMIGRIADIFNEETNGTGRLAAGFGKYDPARLKDGNPESSEKDAHYAASRVGNVIIREFGSNVVYANAINSGFTVPQTRHVKIGDKWVTVHPFSFRGVKAVERGMHEVGSNPILIKQISRQRLGPLGFV